MDKPHIDTPIKIVFTGGGSGGHTMPAVSLINSLKEKSSKDNKKIEILYIGSHNGIEKEIVQKNHINYRSISTGKLRRYFSIKNFIDLFRIVKGLVDSFFILKKFKPNLLFSTGGFVAVPPVVVANLLGIKTVIHEQTIDAGLANKISSKFADKVCLTFKESEKYFPKNKVIVTGIPLREKIYQSDIDGAKKRFGFDYSRPTVFFTGGGLGCHTLNKISLRVIPLLLEKVNVIYQSGNSNEGEDYRLLEEMASKLSSEKRANFKLFNFVNDEIADIFKITDLAIGRSGAGTVCELAALKIPAIFIPLAIATKNEQYKNAKLLSDIGSAIIIEETNLNENFLIGTIESILFTDKLSIMKNNFEKMKSIDGRDLLLELILNLINFNR